MVRKGVGNKTPRLNLSPWATWGGHKPLPPPTKAPICFTKKTIPIVGPNLYFIAAYDCNAVPYLYNIVQSYSQSLLLNVNTRMLYMRSDQRGWLIIDVVFKHLKTIKDNKRNAKFALMFICMTQSLQKK